MNIPRLPSRYAILGALGQGGEGRVFRVRDSLRGIDLALKITSPELAHWLRQEFQTLRQVRHANLIRVFDWGLSEVGEVFYTMELVIGSDWGARMGKPQSYREVARILSGLLRGLAHLHSHGEVHGDLKPGNVLLSKDGATKLTDVGMAAVGGQSARAGTPGYAAPELWEGSPAEIRADIYSVGVMAYEAITGQHPFRGRTIREVVSGQLDGWVPSPAALGAQVPSVLERAIMRALERDPDLRPGTADEFMDLLDESDSIGHILGGRFVARATELAELGALLEATEPMAPTLVWVGGESGIGKTALIEEIESRALGKGQRVVHATALSDVGAFRSPLEPTFDESEKVWALTRNTPTVFLLDAPDDAEQSTRMAVRTLARHLQAISGERGCCGGAVLICETHAPLSSSEEFERALWLQPLPDGEVDAFLRGYLGTVELQPEVVTWLGSVTGGVPGRLTSVIAELIDRRLLWRSGGKWAFSESHDFASIEGSLRHGTLHYTWIRLSESEQAVLALLAIMPQGLDQGIIERVLDGALAPAARLLEMGWLRTVSGRLQVASGEIRRTVLDGSDPALTSSWEEELLQCTPTPLGREERASLLLRNYTTTESLEEGLWAASAARKRGDLRATITRSRKCHEIATRLRDAPNAERAEFILAQALHLLGSNDEAVRQLTLNDRDPSAARDHLLGVIRRSQGDLDAARAHLTSAIAFAERDGDSAVFLQSHAELAEVDWRHGDEKARDAAIRRVKEALASEAASRGSVSDRAALVYQLGSALIVTGKRDEARVVLEDGLALSPDDYWTMRLATALAAAEYYLGRFEKALQWMDEAWRRAERGGFDLFKARIFSNRASIHYGLGKFREAVEYHRLSAVWARRSGQEFEYLAAASNEAVNLMLLGDYESALNRAQEARSIAVTIGNEYQSMKNCETEALCLMFIGDYARAERLAEDMFEQSGHFGYSDMAPRALLLKGMLAEIACNWSEARSQLAAAEEMLLKSRDWEDLPAVQIELQWIRAQDDPRAAASSLASIVQDVTRSGACTVQLRGAFVLGEILLAGRIDDLEYRSTLLTALGRASEAGASEDEWRLNYVLGELYLRGGDRKSAAVRFTQALRGFRSIAEDLSAEHRRYYLRTPHGSRLLVRAA